MRVITILLAFAFIQLSAIAQENKSICIPFTVAKQIQQDLISKDSSEKMLELSYEEISLLVSAIQSKDSVIDTINSDRTRLKSIADNERNMKITYKGIAEDCNKQFNALNGRHASYKKFTKLVGLAGVAVIAGLTAVILLLK